LVPAFTEMVETSSLSEVLISFPFFSQIVVGIGLPVAPHESSIFLFRLGATIFSYTGVDRRLRGFLRKIFNNNSQFLTLTPFLGCLLFCAGQGLTFFGYFFVRHKVHEILWI